MSGLKPGPIWLKPEQIRLRLPTDLLAEKKKEPRVSGALLGSFAVFVDA
jgi:hypothetical protein